MEKTNNLGKHTENASSNELRRGKSNERDMSRFDVEKFESVPDPDLICCICQCVLDGPVESPCRHVFCKVCIETWLRRNRNCPTCRHRLEKRHLKPILPIVQNMLNRLLMFCDFRINGCDERLPLEIYDKHVKECDFKMVECKYEKCFVSVLRKFLKKHEDEECEYREKLCTKVCGLMIPVGIYDGHDCVEELRKYSQEQYALVDTLKKKVTELNTLTEKLNQQIENLRQEIFPNRGRSLSFDLLISSDSDFSLDDFSDYRSSDQENRRQEMTFEEFDRQDRNFWRSLRDFGDRPRRRRTRHRREYRSRRDVTEDNSGEIDVVNTPPRSPTPFLDAGESEIEVDVVNESDVDRYDSRRSSYVRSPRRHRLERDWDDNSSDRSYRSRQTLSYNNSPRSTRDRSSSRSISSDRTPRNRSWSPAFSDRSRHHSSSNRTFQSSRSASLNSNLSDDSSWYHRRRRHSPRRFISSSRSRSRSHSRSFASRFTRSRSRSLSRESYRSEMSSVRSRTDGESDSDRYIFVPGSRFHPREEADSNDTEVNGCPERSREACGPSDGIQERYSSDEAAQSTREWLPRRRSARQAEASRNHSPRRSGQTETSRSYSPRRSGQTEASRNHSPRRSGQAEASQNHSPRRPGQAEASRNHSPRRPSLRSGQTSDSKETNGLDARNTVSSSSGTRGEACLGEGTSGNIESQSTTKRKRFESENEQNESKDNKRMKREYTSFHNPAGCSSTTSNTHQHKSGVSSTERRPKTQRDNSRSCTVTSQRAGSARDCRLEPTLMDIPLDSSGSDCTWEPGTSPNSDLTSPSVYDSVSDITSVYDSGSDYEVLIPKSAGQMLSEYASDESDDSWHPGLS